MWKHEIFMCRTNMISSKKICFRCMCTTSHIHHKFFHKISQCSFVKHEIFTLARNHPYETKSKLSSRPQTVAQKNQTFHHHNKTTLLLCIKYFLCFFSHKNMQMCEILPWSLCCDKMEHCNHTTTSFIPLL